MHASIRLRAISPHNPVSIAITSRSSFFVFSHLKSVGARCIFIYACPYGLGKIIGHTDLQFEPVVVVVVVVGRRCSTLL